MEKRRRTVRLDAALALLLACAGAQACELPGAKRLEAKSLSLAYRTVPAKIPVGAHFALEILVCPKPGAAVPAAIRADATMPEHRHGMNYKPSISVQGSGRFRSEGWMFHMPGRWEFVFETGGERVTDSVRIE
ncbi:MAG: hypothetical protein ACT4P9_08070 [Betaproteobacteria bacterium]